MRRDGVQSPQDRVLAWQRGGMQSPRGQAWVWQRDGKRCRVREWCELDQEPGLVPVQVEAQTVAVAAPALVLGLAGEQTAAVVPVGCTEPARRWGPSHTAVRWAEVVAGRAAEVDQVDQAGAAGLVVVAGPVEASSAYAVGGQNRVQEAAGGLAAGNALEAQPRGLSGCDAEAGTAGSVHPVRRQAPAAVAYRACWVYQEYQEQEAGIDPAGPVAAASQNGSAAEAGRRPSPEAGQQRTVAAAAVAAGWAVDPAGTCGGPGWVLGQGRPVAEAGRAGAYQGRLGGRHPVVRAVEAGTAGEHILPEQAVLHPQWAAALGPERHTWTSAGELPVPELLRAAAYYRRQVARTRSCGAAS